MADITEELNMKQETLRTGLIQFMLNNNDMTWQELGEQVGISYMTILKFLRHKRSISRKTMFKIEQYLMNAGKV